MLIRGSWVNQLQELLQGGATDSDVVDAINHLLKVMPSAVVAKYSIWNNVKCPKCGMEFPYRFRGNLKMRLDDQEVVLIDGCTIDSDDGVFVINVVLNP